MFQTNDACYVECKYVFLMILASALTSIQAHVLEFVVEPADTVVEAGQSAVLDCVVKTASEYPSSILTVQWLDQDRQPLTYLGDSYRSQLTNGSLYINEVVEDQGLTGNYQCMASLPNVGAIVSRIARLSLASLIGFEQEPHDITVYPGQKAYFACRVRANPPPRIRWLKDERFLQLDELRMTVLPSGALEIDDVKDSDQGSYRCNASGLSVYMLSNKANLIINEDQEQASSIAFPNFIALPQAQVTVEGKTITIDCAANGNPYPTIVWLKDGYTIDMANLDSRFSWVGSTTSLQIRNIQESDAGTYQCRAQNREDSQDATATIQVQVPPRFLKKPSDKVDVVNKDVEFECSVYGKPEPKVQWLKNGEIINPTEYYQIVNGNNLKILGLMTSDSGLFQCVASNPAGNIQASASLKVISTDFKPKIRQTKRKKKFPDLDYPKDDLVPINKTQSRFLFSNLQPERSNNFGSKISTKKSIMNTEPDIGIDLDRHKILDSLQSSAPNDIDDETNLGEILSAFTESLPFSKPFIADEGVSKIEGEGLPGPPQNLKASIIKARFITLSWQPPLEPNGDIIAYSVYYKRGNSERERVQNTTRSRLEDINIGGLQPGQEYFFRVVAYNQLGPGASSNSLKVVTQSEEHVPSAPEQFHAFATSTRSIHATWKPPLIQNGIVQSYRVYYMETSSSTEYNIETPNLECDIVGLSIYTEYSVWVVAVNHNGPGAATEEKLVRTFSAPPSEPPTNVTLEASSSTSIVVRWEPPPPESQNGIITGYKLRYRKIGRKGDTITTPANLRSFTLHNLEKASLYQVKLWALNTNGTGPSTEWNEIKTLENDSDESKVPDLPSPLRVRAFSDKIAVMWNTPQNQNIKIRNYILGWGKGVPDMYLQELDEKQRSFVIDKLDSNSDYVISLRASNQMGAGPPVYANVRTRDEPPPEPVSPLIPPMGLKAQVLGPTSVVLYWTDTSLSKSQYVRDNRYYTVKYTAEKSSKSKYINVTDLNVMIDDLKPNTLYEFTVKVVKGKRESPWSMVVQNTTWENTLNSPPKDLTVVPVNDNSQTVELQWQPPRLQNGYVTGYVILYTTDATKRDREWSAHAVKGDKHSDVISNLKPNTEYFFKVQARNSRGYGPFSQIVSYRTGKDSGISNGWNSRGSQSAFSNVVLLYSIGGCLIAIVIVTVILVLLCCRRKETNTSPSCSKKNYQKSGQQIKPPDLWIHHDQMELKEKNHSTNDGASSSGAVTLPRSVGTNEYETRDTHFSNSLDKRTYVPGYMAVATVTPQGATSLSHSSVDSPPCSRLNHPRTQYSLTRAHVTLDQNVPSQPKAADNSYASHAAHTSVDPSLSANSYASNLSTVSHLPSGSSYTPAVSVTAEPQGAKRITAQGYPLKSFSVPAPPPISAPGTPQPKHAIAPEPSVTIRATASPYKKTPIGSNPSINTPPSRINTSNPPPHTAEEVQPLQPSHSTEELNQEMANLEGLMLTLNAITANEFEC